MFLGQMLIGLTFADVALAWMGWLVRQSVVEWRRSRVVAPAVLAKKARAFPPTRSAPLLPSWPRVDLDEVELDGHEELLVRPYVNYWQQRHTRVDALAGQAATMVRHAIRELHDESRTSSWSGI